MTLPSCPDCVVVGGGPAGATAAHELALAGRQVVLLDRAGRIKPCGGAIPPRLIRDFDIPSEQIVARATSARMVSPAGARVDIPIEQGHVGMVDREHFDAWLRQRAVEAGAVRIEGRFIRLERDPDGVSVVVWRRETDSTEQRQRTRSVVGADGARSQVAAQAVRGADQGRCVYAYHEVVAVPEQRPAGYLGSRCEIHYDGRLSPDFYGWVFPHGGTASIGTGSADKGFSLRRATDELRQRAGLADATTLRREGAPIPMKPLPRWDNGRDVVLAGDAAGVVAPASGEGIYYAMLGGRLAAQSVDELIATGDVRALARARRRFMREHGRVFWVLGLMQRVWYANDGRRERFVSICRDRDVQQLTFDAYMNKRLVRSRPMAHVRIFFKDLAHWLGLVRA
ncbi:geranylgeranyl diphosphate reductase [Sphaerotilus mobilis]|uniref:geranylgeranyl diphosphate reductase n=1 Tax=Sphaerotilus mobilis TaxID=47994 RepID=A0A4Q7LVW6_9BURK|nr:geranylgeranyl diphosphate reductase [Sphaerotilus mobilis]RZS58547.1 geranylgeranyl reductase [Sphaerotilus mobilis]